MAWGIKNAGYVVKEAVFDLTYWGVGGGREGGGCRALLLGCDVCFPALF